MTTPLPEPSKFDDSFNLDTDKTVRNKAPPSSNRKTVHNGITLDIDFSDSKQTKQFLSLQQNLLDTNDTPKLAKRFSAIVP